jgi:membrane protein implicated in regulation of membrane protease activity
VARRLPRILRTSRYGRPKNGHHRATKGRFANSLIIIWLPFGLLLTNREYIIAIVPYLVVGVLALLAAGFAFCLVVSAIRWAFIGVRATYLVCKNISSLQSLPMLVSSYQATCVFGSRGTP